MNQASELQNAVRQAAMLYQTGRAAEGEILVRRILAAYPNALDAFNALGGFAFGAGQYDLCVDLMRRAVDLRPHEPLFVRNLGLALESSGRRAAAIDCFVRAIQLKNDYIDPRADLGMALTAAGRLDEAAEVFQGALAIAPGRPDLLNLLGLTRQRQRRLEEAVLLYEQALTVAPQFVDALNNLGATLDELRRKDDAISAFRRALDLKPNDPILLANLGKVLTDKGQMDEAIECHRRAIAADPRCADAHHQLGVTLRRIGQNAQAEQALAEALRLRPAFPEALCTMATLAADAGDLDRAIALYRQAIAVAPNHAEAHQGLGTAFFTRGALLEALAAYQEALRCAPRSSLAQGNVGAVLHSLGRFEESQTHVARALELDPDNSAALCNLASILQEKGDLREAQDKLRRSLALEAGASERHSNLLLCMNYDASVSEEELLAEHRAWGNSHAPTVPRSHANAPDPERRLRIGYVSSDLFQHPVGVLLAAILASHDKRQVEVFCYSGKSYEDAWTAKLKRNVDTWRSTVGFADAQFADLVRKDGIDVLVDLAGHTAGNRLKAFALRPAPVQVSWLGYFATTGVSAVDYVLMDEHVVPNGAERWFVEKVMRLPQTRFCFVPPDYAPEPAPPPVSTRGYPTFGSFNNLSKVTPAVIELWSRILHAAPEAKLLLKWRSLAMEPNRARILERFARNGIGPERIELRRDSPHPEMLREYGDIDIGLDPFPFSGGLTSLEAMWMGIPIVTLPMERAVSRQTLGFLSVVGLQELACSSPDEYVSTAVRLARDPAALAKLRAELRPRMAGSLLCDGPTFTANLEAAYREMWRTWCRDRA